MNRTRCQRWRSFGAPWLPISLLGLLLCAPLLLTTCPGGHDIYHHLIFSHHFSSQLLQGELYPRWLSDMNGGFGSPTFFFYPPVPYYATTLFAWVPEQGALGCSPLSFSLDPLGVDGLSLDPGVERPLGGLAVSPDLHGTALPFLD